MRHGKHLGMANIYALQTFRCGVTLRHFDNQHLTMVIVLHLIIKIWVPSATSTNIQVW